MSFQELYSKIESISRDSLEKTIMNPHVTFVYEPCEVKTELFGSKIKIKIVGYGKSAENEGLKVELITDNPILEEMILRIPVPHITLSISADGKAVNTRYLDFHEIAPIEIYGIFGGCTYSGEVDCCSDLERM